MWAFALLGCRPAATPTEAIEPPTDTVVPTGVTREYRWTVGYGAWDMWLNGEQVVGRATGFQFDGESFGPTVVCDVGDTVRVTLENQTTEPMGITPGGMRYDADNDGLLRVAEPGSSVTYTWEALRGPGVFLWRSRKLDIKLRESQAMAGALGFIVVRGADWEEPDVHLNALMTRTYPPYTAVDNDLPGPWRHGNVDTACPQCVDTGLVEGDLHASHNQTLVLQRITPNPAGETARNPWLTDTFEIPRVEVERGADVRVNAGAFGTDVASFHIEGLDWRDPFSGQIVNTTWIAPGETRFAPLGVLEQPAAHRVENFSSADYGLQSGWLVVSIPE